MNPVVNLYLCGNEQKSHKVSGQFQCSLRVSFQPTRINTKGNMMYLEVRMIVPMGSRHIYGVT